MLPLDPVNQRHRRDIPGRVHGRPCLEPNPRGVVVGEVMQPKLRANVIPLHHGLGFGT